MDADGAQRQITQMVAFILQEAKEKADELEFKTKEDYDTIRNSAVAKAEIQLREAREKRMRLIETNKKREKSKLVNQLRVELMKHRDTKCLEARWLARQRLAAIDKHKEYPKLLEALIVQGLMRLMESGSVTVRCREQDRKIAERLLPTASALYKRLVREQSGRDVDVVLSLDERSLPAGPDANEPMPEPERLGDKFSGCCGGVVLFAANSQILVDNSVEARLYGSYQSLKPEIRATLFGKRAVPANRARAIAEMEARKAQIHGGHH